MLGRTQDLYGSTTTGQPKAPFWIEVISRRARLVFGCPATSSVSNVVQSIVGNGGSCDKRGNRRHPTKAKGEYIAHRFVISRHGLFSVAIQAICCSPNRV